MAVRLAHQRLTEAEKAKAVSALTLSEVRRLPLALRKYRRRLAQNAAQRRLNLKLHIYGTYKIINTKRRKELHRQAQRRWVSRHREQALEIMRRRRRQLTRRYGSCDDWAIQMDNWLKANKSDKERKRLLKYADRLLLESKLPEGNSRRTFIPVPTLRELRLLARKNGSLDLQFLPSKARHARRRKKGNGKEV